MKPLVLIVLLAGIGLTTRNVANAASTTALRPNVLIILADDCTYNDLPLYGGQNAKTPNLDRLAAQGLTFNRAYVTMAMCQPARAELYTGQFPLRNGCAWNHSPSRPGTRSLPDHLKASGYRVGLAGKSHVQPVESYAFETVPGFDENCVRRPTQAHQLNGVREFMSRKAEEPFCLVVALVEPHVPWVMGDASQYPPDRIKLPANIADTKRTREDFGRYLAEIAYMDGQVGEILTTLRATGVESNTLVLFSSEQGSQFPGNKWTCWDTGLRTALIVRWPGRIAAGKRTEALVQYADVAPTLVELAGGNSTDATYGFDGNSFAEVLRGEADAHRRFAYGMHNNQPEGPAYPSRTVTDGAWRYIRNLAPEELYVQKYVMGTEGDGGLNNPYWGTWLFTAPEQPRTMRLVKRYQIRPAEELYHTAADPYEMTNLIADPKHVAVREQLRAELDRWMTAQGDPGRPMDTREALQAARRGEHKFYPQR